MNTISILACVLFSVLQKVSSQRRQSWVRRNRKRLSWMRQRSRRGRRCVKCRTRITNFPSRPNFSGNSYAGLSTSLEIGEFLLFCCTWFSSLGIVVIYVISSFHFLRHPASLFVLFRCRCRSFPWFNFVSNLHSTEQANIMALILKCHLYWICSGHFVANFYFEWWSIVYYVELHSWFSFTRADLTDEKRQEVCEELYNLAKGHMQILIFAHDTSRVIQSLVKHGTKEHRDAVFEELKGMVIEQIELVKTSLFHAELVYGSRKCRFWENPCCLLLATSFCFQDGARPSCLL